MVSLAVLSFHGNRAEIERALNDPYNSLGLVLVIIGVFGLRHLVKIDYIWGKKAE